MKTTALLKRLPTVIMVGLLLYACYTVHASVSDPAPGRSALTNGLDLMINDFLHAGKDEVRGLASVVLRDPFRAVTKAAEASRAAPEVSPDDSTAEALSAIVRGLTLDATFLHGQTRIAIISGRIYHQGQHLVLRGDSGKSYSPLFVQSVQAHGVTLAARGKSYALSYPDQLGNRPALSKDRGAGSADGTIGEIDPEGELAFYKRLLNSPLGKMGKSLTGNTNAGTPAKRGRAASRSARPGSAQGWASGSSP
jgi:hypothetical protein